MSETWNRLQQTLSALGHEPKKSLGQNFLISDHVIEKIIQAAKSFQADHCLEIGPGPGALTFFLKDLCPSFRVIELDRNFSGHWRQQGLEVFEKDALQWDWNQFLKLSGKRILVSNLPYQISSSLVVDRSLDENALEGMVLMFQKEVAQRIKAPHGHDLYGMLSVVAQTFWDLEIVSEAGPRDFFPPPRVSSRVLKFSKKEVDFPKLKFFKTVKACFLHPRKLLSSNLQEAGLLEKSKATEILKELGFSEKARAEELRIADFIQLAGRI